MSKILKCNAFEKGAGDVPGIKVSQYICLETQLYQLQLLSQL